MMKVETRSYEEQRLPASRQQPAGNGLNTEAVGIDVGSRTTKVVLLNGRRILASAVTDTGVDAERSAHAALKHARQAAGIRDTSCGPVVGTGYGRVALSFADKTATELACHARGCHFLDPAIRTVIDVGGQDSKVIQLDAAGNMIDFVMNDKCAAGTGKFLEMAARTLDLDLAGMAGMQADGTHACTLNSMCAVFAETEIISLLAKKKPPEAIVSGLHRAFALRIGNMARRIGLRQKVAFVGGVAKNAGLAGALNHYLEVHFAALDIDPQLTGALGGAVLAQQLSASKGG